VPFLVRRFQEPVYIFKHSNVPWASSVVDTADLGNCCKSEEILKAR
jgi:hypothetical protein